MKTKLLLLFLGLNILSINFSKAQSNVYMTSGGELIFSLGELEYSDDFSNQYSEASIDGHPLRFTCFFHLGQYTHLDLNNNIGLYTGIGIRNIGMISNERLPESYSADPNYQDVKIIRRTYTAGIPLALKIGSFKDNYYVYAGGEYEWAFHMKEKYWDQHNRSGHKSKNTTWWPKQLTTILPSAFLGVQFPKGINIKFKLYLQDFLDNGYGNRNANDLKQVVSDLSKYKSSRLFYISLSFNLKTDEVVKKYGVSEIAGL